MKAKKSYFHHNRCTVFDKIQHLYIILKSLTKLSRNPACLNIMKVTYDKTPQLTSLLNGEKLSFPLRSEIRITTFITPSIKRVLEVLATASRQEKKYKAFKSEGKVKLSLFANDMILYI